MLSTGKNNCPVPAITIPKPNALRAWRYTARNSHRTDYKGASQHYGNGSKSALEVPW